MWRRMFGIQKELIGVKKNNDLQLLGENNIRVMYIRKLQEMTQRSRHS